MNAEAILKPIGKGQITIPLSRRLHLGIDQKEVRAFLRGNQIVIEPLNQEKIDRDVKQISIGELNDETQKAIEQSRKDYKEGKKEKFMSSKQVRNDIL
ncbi:MAG TPA: hypothetical protein P5155_02430 [Candidatus Absconditabacterales bacterium]|nr:hypothetical protein [Candidatus Absconditabacterales bacterium]HOQ79194.1 hypothetical protein [Candidatus Absconditabacterales bacterium]HPK27678.1 hypothetical protein [Candidatus Absconditabacterales bacterium]HRU50338.1 hypothetical protein [Candidatus Absconditabacterales bacterium]